MISDTAHPSTLDLAPTRSWRQFVPLWLRSLIWVDAAEKYDAFLSYSWKSDSKVAPVFQSVIQNFLCPWYKTRALTVFRDLSCLPAGSNLEAELYDRLDKSAHLIVLASPEAKSSHGMEIEAKHWFSRPRTGQVLIVVTSGEFEKWEQIRDSLLPPAMAHNLREEPLFIPLQKRRERILGSPSEHQLREDLVEDLHQILLCFYPGRNWAQLRGEERLQRRRAWHLVWGVIVLLLLLLASASGFAWYALEQRDAAEERLAQNYWQSSRSAKAVGNDVEALHLAAEAIRLEPSLEVAVLLDVRDILMPPREMFEHNGGVKGAVFNRDESRILTWSDDGTARVWPLNVDFDFPADAVERWVETITGFEYDFVVQQAKGLDSPRWRSIRQQYEKIASDHAKTCKYPEVNQWLVQSNGVAPHPTRPRWWIWY
jgi:hypothetical protein